MKLDVLFTPAGLTLAEVQGRTVFVIDILRATTSMCAALHHGAKAIIPVASTEEALRLAQTIGSEDVLLAGERELRPDRGIRPGQQPAGDDRSHRPREDHRAHHHQRHQGAAGLPGRGGGAPGLRGQPERSPRSARARRWSGTGTSWWSAPGRDGAFSLDDAYCRRAAAWPRLWGARRPPALNDAALASLDLVRRYGDDWERPLGRSRAGRELVRLGFGEDVRASARLDAYPVLPPSTSAGSPWRRWRYEHGGAPAPADDGAPPAGRAHRAGGRPLPRAHAAAVPDHRPGRRLSRPRPLAAARCRRAAVFPCSASASPWPDSTGWAGST